MEENSDMYISHDIKNGGEYAKICTSIREGTKVRKDTINLGRVLDKERGIYQSRERGIFVYDLKNNLYSAPPEDFVPVDKVKKQSLILDFGDAFFS